MTTIDKLKNLTQEQFETLYRVLPDDKKWVLLWSSVALILAAKLNVTAITDMVAALLISNSDSSTPPARVAYEFTQGAQGKIRSLEDLERIHNCDTCADKHNHQRENNKLVDEQKNAARAAHDLLENLGLSNKTLN